MPFYQPPSNARARYLPRSFHRATHSHAISNEPTNPHSRDTMDVVAANVRNTELRNPTTFARYQAAYNGSKYQNGGTTSNEGATNASRSRESTMNMLPRPLTVERVSVTEMMMRNALTQKYLPEYIIKHFEAIKKMEGYTNKDSMDAAIQTLLGPTINAFNITNYQAAGQMAVDLSIFMPVCLRAPIASNHVLQRKPTSSGSLEYSTYDKQEANQCFLSLPSEIRNIVYAELLTPIAFTSTTTSPSGINLVTTTRDPRNLLALKALLLTCRQTYEDISLLYADIPKTHAVPSLPALLRLPPTIQHLELSFSTNTLVDTSAARLYASLLSLTALAHLPNLLSISLVLSSPSGLLRPFGSSLPSPAWTTMSLLAYGPNAPPSPAINPADYYGNHFFFDLGVALQRKSPEFSLVGGHFEREGGQDGERRSTALLVLLTRG